MTCRTSLFCRLVLLAVTLLAIAGCSNSTEPEQKEWRLVWQDEFAGRAGQPIDSTRWRFDIGTDWGNAQLEYDTRRLENVSLDGEGRLAITARKETYLGRNYTSARITTKGLFERTYGRFEARMRLPWGQGIWPAFWLLGGNIDTVPWPACGEIDIMEYFGNRPSTVTGSLHGPGYSGAQNVGGRFNLVNGRFDSDFHVFAVEWGADYIRWFVDGTLFNTLTPRDVPGRWVYDHSFYIILNLAVGGYGPGSPNASTVFPQIMLVDYVRVYEEVP